MLISLLACVTENSLQVVDDPMEEVPSGLSDAADPGLGDVAAPALAAPRVVPVGVVRPDVVEQAAERAIEAGCGPYAAATVSGSAALYTFDDDGLGIGELTTEVVGSTMRDGVKVWEVRETGTAEADDGSHRWESHLFHTCDADGLHLLETRMVNHIPSPEGDRTDISVRTFDPPLRVWTRDLTPGSSWDVHTAVHEVRGDGNERTFRIDATRSVEPVTITGDAGTFNGVRVTETTKDGNEVTFDLAPGVGVVRAPGRELVGYSLD
jgi:hypothetical protein